MLAADDLNYSSFDELMEEGPATDEILTRFAHEILRASGELVREFHFGCGPDRIEWDDKDFSHMEIAPRSIIALDFAQLSGGRFEAVTYEAVHLMLFGGRYRGRTREALKTMLRLERLRNGRSPELDKDGAEIDRLAKNARDSISASFRAMSKVVFPVQTD